MIEPTPEMKQAIADRIEDAFATRRTGHVADHREEIAEIAVAAVLAIVERVQEAAVIERLSLVYCTDCGIRMFPDTRHPHELIPVTVTVARRPS